MQKIKPTRAVIAAMATLLILASASGAEDTLVYSAPDTVLQHDSANFDPGGLVIDSIIIENLNIHERTGQGVSKKLFNLADRLRWVTRKDIIANELLFSKGDTYSQTIVDETARNLRTHLAINDAWITSEPSADGGVIVRVTTRDRWTLLGNLKVNRDGNETDFQFGMHEYNLWGRNHLLAFDYYIRESDENYLKWRYINRRFRGKKVRLELEYSDDPENELKSVSVSQPFYNLSQSIALSASVSDEGGRHDEYRDTLVVAQWQKRADILELDAVYRWGGYLRKVNFGIGYRYLYQVTSDTATYFPDTTWGFPEDSITHQVVGSIALTDQQFIVERGINGFYYAEDLTLEKSLTVQIGRAFNPSFSGHRYDLFTWRAKFAHRFNGNIISLAYERAFWFRSSQTIREVSQVSAILYNRQVDFLTGVIRARFVSEKRDDNRPVLNLGGKSGLRGYDTRYSTGDRELLINLEARFFPGLEILSLLVGPVVFADIGRTWDVDEPLRIKHFESSVGLGLRLSAEKHTRTQLIRIDLAYGQNNDWHFSFGSGQYF